ncbi:uncharacterized protein [Spinacia oleracea]|uniref:Reverse transcriptase domain-containing protein n=1 Tax=Spinacia oleracea TaxID=3562 RepID=A0A9R0K4T1_SPIOL|nr:uncharacterized protein LOC110796772 [Spinacia oleracea]
MARKSGSKSQSSKHGNGKGKPRGPSSDSQALKTRSIEEVLGVEALDFGVENEIFTPKSGLQHLQTRSEMRHSFNEFMEVIHGSANQMIQGNARSNMAVGTISIPILQQFDEVANTDTEPIAESNSVSETTMNLEHIDLDNTDDNEFHNAESNPVKIDVDDIQEEIDFWNSVVVCYIVGVNPPMEGFIRRIWKQLNADKVVMVRKGVFLVRFLTMDSRDKVLTGHYFFDSKPLILKPWNPYMDMDKPELQSAFFKIVAQLGKPIRRDHATICRDKLQFARVMGDVPLSQDLPDYIYFRDKNGVMVRVVIFYEWRPTRFTQCKMFGHLQAKCRQGMKRVWVRKASQPVPAPIQPITEHVASLIVDQEGFHRSLRPIRVRVESEVPVRISNAFQVLDVPLIDNAVLKQNKVKHFIQKHAVGLVGLLEHKVKLSNLGKLYQRVFTNWCFTSNSSFHSGGRIVVAWKYGCFTVNIVVASSQFVHCHITPVSGMHSFYCTFIYAFNDAAVDERTGATVRHSDIVDISNCIHACGMEYIKCVGRFFTWNNKQQGSKRVFSKIDRIMANQAWQGCFSAAEVCFMPEGHFDHSPGLLTVYPRSDGGRKPFKYFIMWKSSPVFSDTIQKIWSTQIVGNKMFTLVSKLKKVKQALRELNKVGFTNVQADDLKAYQDMIAAQSAMHNNPTDSTVADAELKSIQEYKDKHKAYLAFLSQKSKVAWLKEGDDNTALFHQSIKARKVQNQVDSIYDMNGDWKVTVEEQGLVCQDHHKNILNTPYTADEVKNSLFSIPGVKAPGPDGFGSYFYKDAWHIVGDDVIIAILDMLQNGELLKEVNHTVITLIPKTKCPKDVSEFRPISCCKTIYKCITKVLCGRLRQVLPDLILENQGGFVHRRYIVHNIMVVQDLVKHYGRKGVKPSCLMKIDLQKAYDTVDWHFLQDMLTYLVSPIIL